jgi:hypothetical protein
MASASHRRSKLEAASATTADARELPPTLAFMRLLWAIDHGLRSVSKRMHSSIGLTGPQRLVLRIELSVCAEAPACSRVDPACPPHAVANTTMKHFTPRRCALACRDTIRSDFMRIQGVYARASRRARAVLSKRNRYELTRRASEAERTRFRGHGEQPSRNVPAQSRFVARVTIAPEKGAGAVEQVAQLLREGFAARFAARQLVEHSESLRRPLPESKLRSDAGCERP